MADGRRFSLARGQLYLLPPSSLVEMASSGQAPLGLYLLKFQALRENGHTDKTVLFAKETEAAGFPYTGRLPEQLYAGAIVAVEPLCRHPRTGHGPGPIRRLLPYASRFTTGDGLTLRRRSTGPSPT